MRLPTLNKNLDELSPDKRRAIDTLKAEAETEKATLEAQLDALAEAIVTATERRRVAVKAALAEREKSRSLPYGKAQEVLLAANQARLRAGWALTNAINANQGARQRIKELAIAIGRFDGGIMDASLGAREYLGGNKGSALVGGHLMPEREAAMPDRAELDRRQAEAGEAASKSWAEKTAGWLADQQRQAEERRQTRIQRQAEEALAADAMKRAAQRAPKAGGTDAVA